MSTRLSLASSILTLTLLMTAVVADPLPFAGRIPTGYTLGSGGFMAGGGFMPFDSRLPRPNSPVVRQNVTVGGLLSERQVSYFGDGSLVPVMIGFAVGETTDFYLTGTISGGASEKRIRNFYGVPDAVYVDSPIRFDRVYEQPLFDFGIGLKSQLKPDLGDGLPAVAVGLSGRFGYTADDYGSFHDTSPADGYPDAGITGYTAVTKTLGDLFVFHAIAGAEASKKFEFELLLGGGVEFELLEDTFVVSADYLTRRDIAGIEYGDVGDKLTVGFRYHLTRSTAIQALASPEGHLLVNFVKMGSRAEGLAPTSPSFEDGLF